MLWIVCVDRTNELIVAGNENEPRGVNDVQEKVAKLGAMIWWW